MIDRKPAAKPGFQSLKTWAERSIPGLSFKRMLPTFLSKGVARVPSSCVAANVSARHLFNRHSQLQQVLLQPQL